MDAPVDAVELVRATSPADLAALRRLYALYLHDLSEFTSHYELDEEARWQPDYLEDMLTWSECHCLLILAGGKPAGFALVSRATVPAHAARRGRAAGGVLRRAAVPPPGDRARGRTRGSGALPWSWVLEVVTGNEPALAFWRVVTGDATGGDYAEIVGEGELSLRFSTG